MAILGLDISTSCTGWCLLSDSGEIVDIGYIELSRKSGLFEKAKEVEHKIYNLSKAHTIHKVFIKYLYLVIQLLFLIQMIVLKIY